MDRQSSGSDSPGHVISIVGLGPGDLDRVPGAILDLLSDPGRTIIVRTLHHPAAAQLAETRDIVSCDDLYAAGDSFASVYAAIRDRVLAAAEDRPVVYAVPGSPHIGEFSVRQIVDSGSAVEVIPGESFVDAVLHEVGYDPLDRGLQILDGHSLPDPLVLDKPTIIAQLDSPVILADVCARVDRVTSEDSTVLVLVGMGAADSSVTETLPARVDPSLAGYRTSLFIDVEPGGLIGAVHTMRILREECPWDREQTHASLIKNLVEESYELIDAISELERSQDDWVAYAAVEDELGDVLLQVLFHAVIARQAGGFDIDDVAEVMRQKLIRRHPHVFGDVRVESAEDVKRNWDSIKEQERSGVGDSSMDGIPVAMPALQRASKVQNRAAKVGFDWDETGQVLAKVHEELDELAVAMSGEGDVVGELGDVMFSIVNLSRHLGIDAEITLRSATRRFEERFRRMESEGPLADLDLDELNLRWDRAKQS